MDSYLYLAIALLLASSIKGRAIDDLDNSIQSTNNRKSFSDPEWVEITQPPPRKVVQHAGTTVELECEVTGSPLPSIQWIYGTNPNNVIDTVDSNQVSESSPNAIARVRSRLIVEHSSGSDRLYTCVGSAGTKTAYESTIVTSSAHKPHNISELLSEQNASKKARITLFYGVLFDMIGTNVILPCQTYGDPTPDILWLDSEDNVIDGRDHRVRVHSSGALYISSLRWSDMGTYTCVAKNAGAKDTVTTFVYPIMVTKKL